MVPPDVLSPRRRQGRKSLARFRENAVERFGLPAQMTATDAQVDGGAGATPGQAGRSRLPEA
jgi:hypothetical protein